jgi:hypothetical protein
MSKRKLPDSIVEGVLAAGGISVLAAGGMSATAEVTNPQPKKTHHEVLGQPLYMARDGTAVSCDLEVVTPPRRTIPKDSPAYAFVQTSPIASDVKVGNLYSVS